VAVDGDRFRGHRAEPAGIQAVDLAIDGRLGDRARKGLARRRAAAWIGVIADTGHPDRLAWALAGVAARKTADVTPATANDTTCNLLMVLLLKSRESAIKATNSSIYERIAR
jgi:hypothetical protein